MIGEPRLLMLDEPSRRPGADRDRPHPGGRVAGCAAEGMAILLVEQLVEKALRHADHGYLIETGRIAGDGTPRRRCAGRSACDASTSATARIQPA